MDRVIPAFSLLVPAACMQIMRADVTQRLPEEACGLLAGRDEQVYAVIPLENILHSPVRFRIEPRRQIRAFNWLEQQGWSLVGIYHSHPAGPPDPSPTDLAEAWYPDAAYLIWSHQTSAWECRAFRIQDQQALPIEIVLADDALAGETS